MLVRVRRNAQITLPAEVRRALQVNDGDYLQAEVTGDGILLRPVSVVDRQGVDRERAWDSFMLHLGDEPAEPHPEAIEPEDGKA